MDTGSHLPLVMTKSIHGLGFGERLRELMAARGFTQSRLSRHSGIERTVINRMISGKIRPRPEQIAWMAKSLGVDAHELMAAAELPTELRELVAQLRDANARIGDLERELQGARDVIEDLRRRQDLLREPEQRGQDVVIELPHGSLDLERERTKDLLQSLGARARDAPVHEACRAVHGAHPAGHESGRERRKR